MNSFEELYKYYGSLGGFIPVNKRVLKEFGISYALILAEVINQYIGFKRTFKLTPDGYFYLTVNSLADATGVQETTQRDILKRMETDGLIRQDVRFNGFLRCRYLTLDESAVLQFLKNLSLEYNQTSKNEALDCSKNEGVLLKKRGGTAQKTGTNNNYNNNDNNNYDNNEIKNSDEFFSDQSSEILNNINKVDSKVDSKVIELFSNMPAYYTEKELENTFPNTLNPSSPKTKKRRGHKNKVDGDAAVVGQKFSEIDNVKSRKNKERQLAEIAKQKESKEVKLAKTTLERARNAISAYTSNKELIELFVDFIQTLFETKIGFFVSNKRLDGFIKDLDSYDNDFEKMDILNKCIASGYLRIYPKDKKSLYQELKEFRATEQANAVDNTDSEVLPEGVPVNWRDYKF